jgi:protein TonB
VSVAFIRPVLLALGAVLINLALYLLMESMISRDRTRVLDLFDAQIIEFVRTSADDETRTKDRRRQPPPKPREVKKPRAEVQNVANRSELPADFDAYNVKSLLGEGGGIALGERLVQDSGDAMRMVLASDLTPLARIPPQYPPYAMARGIEGWVDLSFIVTVEGTVHDVVVVDAQPPGVFDMAAVNAVSRWRYQPVVEDGRPVPARVFLHVDFGTTR